MSTPLTYLQFSSVTSSGRPTVSVRRLGRTATRRPNGKKAQVRNMPVKRADSPASGARCVRLGMNGIRSIIIEKIITPETVISF